MNEERTSGRNKWRQIKCLFFSFLIDLKINIFKNNSSDTMDDNSVCVNKNNRTVSWVVWGRNWEYSVTGHLLYIYTITWSIYFPRYISEILGQSLKILKIKIRSDRKDV